MNWTVIELTLWTIPFLVVGMLLGNFAHNKIKDDTFVKFVYGVLFISCVFMII